MSETSNANEKLSDSWHLYSKNQGLYAFQRCTFISQISNEKNKEVR